MQIYAEKMLDSASETNRFYRVLLAIIGVICRYIDLLERPIGPDLASVPCRVRYNFAHLTEIGQVDRFRCDFVSTTVSCDYFCDLRKLNKLFNLLFLIQLRQIKLTSL